MKKYDVAIIGAGIAGMSTALRLQAKGKSTLILEAHGQPGGCAGFYSKKGFNFDVGATTLVDFETNGIGGDFLNSVGLDMPVSESLDYLLWLPDRSIQMFRDKEKWSKERAEKLGNNTSHQAFWAFMDKLSNTFWAASRKGIKLPIQNVGDLITAVKALGFKGIALSRFLNYTLADALKMYGLENDKTLNKTLAMLVEDTVNSTLDEAPLINAALGVTIRGAGLRRAQGGMKGFWTHLRKHYESLGGTLLVGHKVEMIEHIKNGYLLTSRKGTFEAQQLISAITAQNTMDIAPPDIKEALAKYVRRDFERYESAIVLFLGVPDSEVACQSLTHHQLLYDYDLPLGNGNNMFISVSSPGDTYSAPAGYRSVMISTHCKVSEWQRLTEEEYQLKKNLIGSHLLNLARRVYPKLGEKALVYEIGTPRSYQKYTNRINGTVGGVRQNLANSNLNAIPHDLGFNDFRMVGDSTWPGLGTVACLLGSNIVARQLLK